ncbi:MAG: LysM peptidoglycan-binding domain-containing protein [Bacillota bacterium]
MATKKEMTRLYKLSKNESLQSVARKFGIAPQILAFKNSDITFKAGATIVIPKPEGEFYKVSAGDTIESICEKFAIDKTQFYEKNGVNFIYHGMIVSI